MKRGQKVRVIADKSGEYVHRIWETGTVLADDPKTGLNIVQFEIGVGPFLDDELEALPDEPTNHQTNRKSHAQTCRIKRCAER